MKFYLILLLIGTVQVINAAPNPSLFGKLFGVVTKTVDNTVKTVTNVVDQTVSTATNVVDQTVSTATNVVKDTATAAGNVITTTVTAVADTATAVVETVLIVPKVVIVLIQNLSDSLRKLGDDLLNASQSTSPTSPESGVTSPSSETVGGSDLVATIVAVGTDLSDDSYESLNMPVDDSNYITVAGAIVNTIKQETVDDRTGIEQFVSVTNSELDQHFVQPAPGHVDPAL